MLLFVQLSSGYLLLTLKADDREMSLLRKLHYEEAISNKQSRHPEGLTPRAKSLFLFSVIVPDQLVLFPRSPNSAFKMK